MSVSYVKWNASTVTVRTEFMRGQTAKVLCFFRRVHGSLPLNRGPFLTHTSTSGIITRQLRNRTARWEIKLSPLNCTPSLKDAESPLAHNEECCVLLLNMHSKLKLRDESEVRQVEEAPHWHPPVLGDSWQETQAARCGDA